MLRNLIVLPDGTEIFSGSGAVHAIQSSIFTSCVNSGTELTLGSVCCNALEVKFFAPAGNLNIASGTEVTLYKVDDAGGRYKVGIFALETPARPSKNTYKFTAYDRISWLDKNLSEWLGALDGWPYRLDRFAQMVCEACGLTLATSSIPNGEYQVQKFLEDATGRQLMQWIGEACGRFCRANADGEIEFAWYKAVDKKVGASGDFYIFQNSLTYEDYQVAPIDKVRLQVTEEDPEIAWPNVTGEINTYSITGNPLLANGSPEALLSVVQNIFNTLSTVCYTPCKVSIPANLDIRAGDIVEITDRNGKTITTYVMTKTQKGQRDTLESTGSYLRSSSSVVNNQSFADLKGKIFSVSKSVEGLRTTAKDLEGKYTQLEQTAGQVSVSVGTPNGTLKTEITSTPEVKWEAKYVDAKGNTLSGFYFDFEKGQFIFDGSGKFSGELNIGDGNFVVDVNGNVTAHGNTRIYGGRYYAMGDDGTGGYTAMEQTGFVIYNAAGQQLIKVGYPADHDQYPYIILSSSENGSTIYKRFDDGSWLGNDAPAEAYGEFEPQTGYAGIFISNVDGKTYVVSGTNMKNIYTGEAIARFG